MKPIKARDCLPFDSRKDWKESDKRKADEALRKLCEYFENTNEVSEDDDDKIVSLQTLRFRYDNDEQATVQTRWWLNLLRRRIWVDKCAKANRYGLPRKNVKKEYQGIALRGALDIRRTIMPWFFYASNSTRYH